MERKEYNGWTNYATWLTNLWIDNDTALYTSLRGMMETYVDDARTRDAALRQSAELRQGLGIECPHRRHTHPPFRKGDHDPPGGGVGAHAGRRDVRQPRHQRQILESIDEGLRADWRGGRSPQQAGPDDEGRDEGLEEPVRRAHGPGLLHHR